MVTYNFQKLFLVGMWEYPREGQGIGEIELDQKLIEVDTTNQQPKREQIPQESNEQVLALA